MRAINRLCNGEHENVIHVYQHGLLRPHHAFYFIDMELCDITLDKYIYNTNATPVRGLLEWQRATKEGHALFIVCALMQQILAGLSFIHGHNEVHRDLSPPNSEPCCTFYRLCL